MSYTSGSGRMRQGTHTGHISLPWAAQSVLWKTQHWVRWLFALTNFVFQRIARLNARVRQEDIAWNKKLWVSIPTSHPPPFFFFTLGSTYAILEISDTYHPSGNWPEGQTAPNTHRGRGTPSLCHCTLLVLLSVYPGGTLHAELPLWEKFISPFPEWGRENYQH